MSISSLLPRLKRVTIIQLRKVVGKKKSEVIFCHQFHGVMYKKCFVEVAFIRSQQGDDRKIMSSTVSLSQLAKNPHETIVRKLKLQSNELGNLERAGRILYFLEQPVRVPSQVLDIESQAKDFFDELAVNSARTGQKLLEENANLLSSKKPVMKILLPENITE